MSRRKTTKKVLISPQLSTRAYDIQHPYVQQGAVYDALKKQYERRQQEEAEAQATEVRKQAEAKKKELFEEAEQPQEKQKVPIIEQTQEQQEVSSSTAKKPSKKQKEKGQDFPTTDWGKWFKDQLDQNAAKKFVPTNDGVFSQPTQVEDPSNFNYIIDPYASERYNQQQKKTAEAAVEREIRRQYGAEIDAYDEQLRAAEEYDAKTNTEIDRRNQQMSLQESLNPGSVVYQPHVDTAGVIRQKWENSDTYQKIQATRDYILQNYTPNEALANKVIDFGTSEYNQAYTKSSNTQINSELYKVAKKQYDSAVKKLNAFRRQFGMSGPNSEESRDKYEILKNTVQQRSQALLAVEKQFDSKLDSKEKYEQYLSALSNSIRTQGLPKTKDKLTTYSQYIINQLGLMDVLYKQDGSLNEDFVGVGYSSDQEIKNAAKAATDYFASTNLTPDADSQESYLNNISEDVELRKEMYSHLMQNDIDANDEKRKRYNSEYKNLERAQVILDKARRHKELSDVVKRADGFWTKQTATNIGYGIAEKIKDPGMWTFGVSDFLESRENSNLADKIKSGQKLTNAEKTLASSLAIESVMHQNYDDYEQTGGYKAGQIATESMKFMAEMAMTSGVSGFLQSSGKAAMKAAANKYIRKYGADGFKHILGRNLAKTPGFLKMVGGDAAYSMILANSLQLPSTLAEINRLTTGQLTTGVVDGELTITGYEDAESLPRAIYEAEARAFTENMSEMIGEYGIGAFLKYPFKYAGKVAVGNSQRLAAIMAKGSSYIERAQNLINNMRPTRAAMSFIKPVGSFIKAGHYSGIVGETAEEYYGNAMQHLFGVSEGTKTVVDEDGNEKQVKTSFWEEINPTTELGKQTFLDIVGGIALSTGFLGAGSALNYARIAHNYDKSRARLTGLVGKDVVEKMENALTQSHSANVASTANSIIRGITNASHREAFIDFYENMMKFHGASQADQKFRESNDVDIFERAKREAEINGYSVQYNTQRADLQRAVDSIKSYTEQQLGVEDGTLDQVIEDNGGVAEFVSYLKSSGNDSLASAVMAYNNTKAQYEASMRRLADDIDEDLLNNEKWINRLSNDAGKIVVGTTKTGKKVFVKSGTHVVDGEIKSAGDEVVVVYQDGSVGTIKSNTLNDKFEEIDANEIKHDIDLETYRSASEGLDLSNTSNRVGVQIQMSKGRVGTILNKTVDGRIMYSVNDPSTNTEVVRITDPGVTEEQLVKEWTDSYTLEFQNEQIKKAQTQLNHDVDRSAQVVATKELREYIHSVKENQRKDLETKHGKAIKYASGVLTSGSVDKVLNALKNTKFGFVGAYAQIFNQAGVTVDASNWERLRRLIEAFRSGQLSKKEFKEILADGSTKMSASAKEDLENISVDQFGNVTRWEDQNDTNLYTHSDIADEDLSEETLDAAEDIINEDIRKENKFLNSKSQIRLREKEENEQKAAEKKESKKRGESGRNAAKKRRAELKKTRKQKQAEKTKKNEAKLPQKINQQASEHRPAAPAPTQGSITDFVVKQQQFPNQQNGIEKLQKHADWTEANVLRDQTTSHNYFIMINGRRVMFTRVHGILDDQYENLGHDVQVNANIEKLKNAYNAGGIDALKKEIESMMKLNKVDSQSVQYTSYLDENPDEYEAVIEGVANVSAPINFGASVIFGQYIDEMCRMFFSGEEINLDVVFQDGTTVGSHMDQKALDKFVEQCKDLKSIYDALGWELMPNRAVFTYQVYDNQTDKNVNIAGETDMIAVDKQGNYHIIDFKTSYKSFDSFFDSKGNLINLFESVPSSYKGKRAKRSTKEQYENQQTMYSLMVESTLDGTVQSVEIMPFTLNYDSQSMTLYDIENRQRVLNNEKSGTYNIKVPQRIILNKSGKLINRFSERKNDKDAAAKKKLNESLSTLSEFVPISDVSNLPESQKQHIEQLASEINDRIKKVKDASKLVYSEGECTAISQEVDSIKNDFEDLYNYMSEKVEDNNRALAEAERLRKQKEADQQSHDAWLQQQATAQQKWEADWKATFEADYNKLLGLCRYLDNWAKQHGNNYTVQPELKEQFDQLVSNLQYMIEFDDEVLGTTTGRILGLDTETIDKVNRCIEWVQNNVQEVAPVQPIVPPTSIDSYSQPEKSWKNTNGLYKDEFNGSTGVSSSVALDDNSLFLSSVTKNADFIDNSEFRLIANNGRIYVQITYGGHTYTPVAFFTARTDAGRKLYGKILNSIRSAKSGQKVIISDGVKRSFGEFIVKEEGQYGSAHEKGMIALSEGESGINVYDIEYSSTQSNIGITYTREIQNGNSKVSITEVRVPSSEDVAKQKFERQTQSAGWVTDKATGAKRRMQPDSPYALAFGSAIYTYSNVNPRKPKSSGIFVFMHNLGYTDDPKCCVPVTMRRSLLSQNDAKFIIDALLGNYNGLVKKNVSSPLANNILGFSTTTTEFVKGFGGNVVVGGQTIDVKISDILDLLIPVKGCPSYESFARRQSATERMPIYMDLDNVNETGEVLIVGNIEGDGIETMQRSFNIRTNDGQQKLEEFLQSVQRNMNMNGFAQARLGNIGSNTDQYGYPMPLSNNPTGGMTLKEYVQKHGSLKFGNSCIQFDSDDFSNPAIPGDKNGISGIGWYLKNGFLETAYNGTEDPLIRVEDDAQISVVDENPIEPLKESVSQKEQQAIEQSLKDAVQSTQEVDLASMLQQQLENGGDASSNALDSMLSGFYKEQNSSTTNPINEKEARKNLERILGKNVPVKFIPTLINVSKLGARYVGVCRTDGITLSEQAEAGVEYHEAFHRVMELLFTPEQRQKAYEKFRKAKKGRENLTDNQIAELFADEFMYYATNQPVVKFHWNIIKTFREIKDWVDMWKTIGNYNLFRMYAKINSGKYANVEPDFRSVQDFLERTGGHGYFYTVNGHKFEHILNGVHYKKLLNFIAMSFMHPSIQTINIDGSNLKDFKLDKQLLIRKQLNIDNPVIEDTTLDVPINFFTVAMSNAPESTRLALQEMLDNFDVIKPDLAAYVSLFASDYKVRYEQTNNRKKEGVDEVGGQFDSQDPTSSEDDIYGSWIDDHIKESYEFAPISRATEKTKFFFSAIPKTILTDNGWQLELNELGLPEMYDAQYAFITVLNEVSDCRSIPDLYEKLLRLGEHDGLFHMVAEKFGNRWNDVLNGKATANEQALVTQIFTQLKSTTSEFVLAKSIHRKDGSYDVQIEKTDQSYNARRYVNDWAQSFAVGGCKFFRQNEDGSYQMNGKFTPAVFQQMSSIITGIAESVKGDQDWTLSKINGTKQQLCACLNMLGIPFTIDMLNKYLWSTYNDVGENGLADFIRSNKNDISAFCNKIAQLNYNGKLNIDENGRVDAGNRPSLDKLFANDNFLLTLAKAKYFWHRSHDQMSVLIANNAKAYTKSENNLLTDRLDELMYDEEAQHNLMSDAYNYNSEDNTGSIFLKNLGAKLRFVTMGGFKTDEYGNAGIDYMQQSKREDYIGKAVALLDGYILSPTMSDKKTWGFIAGLEHKMSEFGYGGTNFGKLFRDGIVLDDNGNIVDFYIPDSVVNQMIEYAYCENASIKHTLDQFKLLPDNKKVENFHKGKAVWIKDGKVYTKEKDAPKDATKVYPIQGARYTSLLGIYENGSFVEFNQLVDENGNYKDEWANYNEAQEKFFGEHITHEQRKKMIREILLNRLREELKQVENLGLIERTQVDSNTKEAMFAYKNVGLPTSRVKQIEDQIMSVYDKSKLTIPQLNMIHSLAVVSLVADIMNRHIISMQEFERIFSGNPAFFKFGYDSNGHLIDRTTDQSKRLGGLASTGTNNCLDIPGLPKEYTCVEVDNPMMVAAHIDKVQKDIYEGELRSNYLRYLLEQSGASFDGQREDGESAEQIAARVDAMTVKQIEEEMKDMPLLSIVKGIAESKSKNFKKVDIADGAAYITDEMCENLLRMVGSWSNEIEEAFQILRGTKLNPKTNKPYSVSDTRATAAYNKIYTTVIGAQKYTAYGYRYQDGVAIPYYNKMALFPMFKNMCTGNMAKIYKAAKDQKIDMIMIKSAVKLGNQSTYKITDMDNIDFANNSYVQKYSYLRKQFNTDPKERDLMAMGTQMTKIVMSSLIPGRQYDVNGELKTATQIRNDIMTAINGLSDWGRDEVRKKFFKDGEFDVDAFSKVLKDELSSRGATKELIDGCEIVDGKMRLTLDAMSGMNWIQSILIAMVNRSVIDINTPGHAFYQRSVWGMEGNTNILGDDDLPPSINGGKKLEVQNEDNSMDCVLSIDFFANILKGTKAEHADFESQRKYLMRKGIIGPNAKANMIGYRIPTQAISSIHALRCVDVIPTVRDTVILPAEFTAITGSDKLYQCSNLKKSL